MQLLPSKLSSPPQLLPFFAHLVFSSKIIYLGDSGPFLDIKGSEHERTCGQKRNPPDVNAVAPAQAGIKFAHVAEYIRILVSTPLGTSELHHWNCWLQQSWRFSRTADTAVARQAVFTSRPSSSSHFGVTDNVSPMFIASCPCFLQLAGI